MSRLKVYTFYILPSEILTVEQRKKKTLSIVSTLNFTINTVRQSMCPYVDAQFLQHSVTQRKHLR